MFSAENPAYLYFTPRPDRPADYDQQTSFVEEQLPGVAFLVGGNGAGCLGAEQPIYDPVADTHTPVSQIQGTFHVFARDKDGHVVIARAEQPKVYGYADLYRVTFSNGRSLVITCEHKLLAADQQWLEMHELLQNAMEVGRSSCASFELLGCRLPSVLATQTQESFPEACRLHRTIGHRTHTTFEAGRKATTIVSCESPWQSLVRSCSVEPSLSSSQRCAQSSTRTAQDFQWRCCSDHRRDGEQPLMESGIFRCVFPLPVDVRERNPSLKRMGDLGSKPRCTPRASRCAFHRSMLDFGGQVLQSFEVERRSSSSPCLRSSGPAYTLGQESSSSASASLRSTTHLRSPEASFAYRCTSTSLRQSATEMSSRIVPRNTETGSVYVTQVEFLRHDVYWDFHVPVHENYWAAGVWNHNTTSCSLHKVVTFLMSQPPPRYDTPFWIIGESYDQICETAWKEKLNGQQFLCPADVDWARITWLDSKADHPKTVPLMPWEDRPGKNWMIEFKSYKQGRAEMQGRSIGGFCFVEQFPWQILREVHRGCREYHFPGSMMAEFTPIDPVLSIKLQEMQENGTLPEGWKVYRANTRCAMEAGHVDKNWYQQFFGSMDDAERAVREIGAWATFESQIYPTFNPLLHGITEEEVFCHEGDFPLDSHHFRSIDWGFSAEHAFVCLYGYRWGDSGDWVIYDEYFSTDQRKIVQEHLYDISSRWDWPDDAYHHVTYADPSRQDHIRIAGRLAEYTHPISGKTAPSMAMANASNAVFPGID